MSKIGKFKGTWKITIGFTCRSFKFLFELIKARIQSMS